MSATVSCDPLETFHKVPILLSNQKPNRTKAWQTSDRLKVYGLVPLPKAGNPGYSTKFRSTLKGDLGYPIQDKNDPRAVYPALLARKQESSARARHTGQEWTHGALLVLVWAPTGPTGAKMGPRRGGTNEPQQDKKRISLCWDCICVCISARMRIW